VVQETVVSSHATLLCGNVITEVGQFHKSWVECLKTSELSLLWRRFFGSSGRYENGLFTTSRESFGLFYTVRHRFRHPDEPQLSLWDLLVMFRSKQSTDPPDRTVSFLGMVTIWLKETPLVLKSLIDYVSSVHEGYTESHY